MSNQIKSKLIILTGPVHSGKSAALVNWAAGKSVCGFITPTLAGRKVLQNIVSGEIFPYELTGPEKESVTIGSYHLTKEAFKKANDILKQAILFPEEWIIIDEIGKLELQEEGHHSILLELFNVWKNNLIVVIRDSLLNEVTAKYRLTSPIIIQKQQLIDYQ